MKVLVDTNVLSELRLAHPDERVTRSIASIPHDSLFISVITIGEIVYGISRLAPGPKRRSLGSWLERLEQEFRDSIVAVDLETSRIWGELTAQTQAAGRALKSPDGLIAATAVRHGIHLMTRNVKDFTAAGMMLINPWEE